MVLIFLIFLHQQLRLEVEAFQQNVSKRFNFLGSIRDSFGQLHSQRFFTPDSAGFGQPGEAAANELRRIAEGAGLALKGATTR